MHQLLVKLTVEVTSVSDRNARHFRKTWGGFAALTNRARDWDVFLIAARAMQSDAEYREFRSMLMPQVLANHEAVIEVLQSAQWQRHRRATANNQGTRAW